MKWVIIEGSDNIGKSTLIKKLSKELNIQDIDHFGAPISKIKEEQINEQKSIAQSYIDCVLFPSQHSRVILNDRSIFGELVYSFYRDYYPDYYSQFIEKLKSKPDIECLFIVIYANNYTYQKFNIPNKKEFKNYENSDQSAFISMKFIDEITKLKYGKIVVVNSNNFESLDARNKLITEHVKCFIKGYKYIIGQTNNYSNIPYNIEHRFYHSNIGFLSSSHKKCMMYEKQVCVLGEMHKTSSPFGKTYNKPTDGYGAYKNVKYIFVGEAPGHKGCGKLGIPFYDDMSGNIFQQALYDNNISQFEIYVTNIIKCCPRDNELGTYSGLSMALSLECVKNIKQELDHILKSNEIKTIYAVGAIPHKILSVLYKDGGINIKKLYHPAYYGRMGIKEKYSKYIHDELLEK